MTTTIWSIAGFLRKSNTLQAVFSHSLYGNGKSAYGVLGSI